MIQQFPSYFTVSHSQESSNSLESIKRSDDRGGLQSVLITYKRRKKEYTHTHTHTHTHKHMSTHFEYKPYKHSV